MNDQPRFPGAGFSRGWLDLADDRQVKRVPCLVQNSLIEINELERNPDFTECGYETANNLECVDQREWNAGNGS